MILCSNDFKLTIQDGLSEEEVEWLDKNLIVAQTPCGSQSVVLHVKFCDCFF
jgi:hypothetical protein